MEMSRTNYALFVDLENCGGKVETLTDVIEKVKMRGDILLGRVYGYSDQYGELKELLLSNTFNVVPSIRFGINQKNNLDIQLVIDALEVAYKNDLIDCFCIVSGDSDYTPLVGKLKSMGKYVLGISRSEVASKVFINACNEFIFLETVSSSSGRGRRKGKQKTESVDTAEELNALVERVVRDLENADGFVYASEVKKTVTRLKPDFSEKNYGFTSFGKLLTMLAKQYKTIRVVDDNHILKISVATDDEITASSVSALTRGSWKAALTEILEKFKDDGFDRVNPSLVKAAVTSEYPDFDEHQLGFTRFSDVMRELERDRIVRIEFDDMHSMLVKIL